MNLATTRRSKKLFNVCRVAIAAAGMLAVLLAVGPVFVGAEEPNVDATDTGVDASLFPKAYGALASERLMYPVDLRDWPLRITAERQLLVDDYLIASRDGRHWTRACRGQKILALGGPDAFDSDYLITGRPGPPLVVDGRLRFYYWGARRTDIRDGAAVRYEMHIGVATLRRDGFASINAGDQPGELITRPLTFSGCRLFVNADVAPGGSIRTALLTTDGQPLEGYTLDDATPVTEDCVASPVTWAGASDVQHADGDHIRLQFALVNAKLYAFWIE